MRWILFFILIGMHCFSEEDLESRRKERSEQAMRVRAEVMDFCAEQSLGNQRLSGDEKKYADLRGCFGKALNHQKNGWINRLAYASLLTALNSGKDEDFQKIMMGSFDARLANPQASFCYSLVCSDSWAHVMCPAPSFSSAETAGEMVELYWSALVRDVPFNQFSNNELVKEAIEELNKLEDFRGPKKEGKIAAETFLRGNARGDLKGPYLSQFLYKPIPYGTKTIYPWQEVPKEGADFLTNRRDWHLVINGKKTGKRTEMDRVPQLIRNPRDLAEYVHKDSPGQAALSAALILLSWGPDALDSNNPYLKSKTEGGFVTFGAADILALVRNAIQEGIKAAWYQKWQVNRRLRPEEYGFYLDRQITSHKNLGIHTDLVESKAIKKVFEKYHTYLLPQAYPEGSPTHPSYPAAHATAMGASITVLKAFFNEEFEIPDPVAPDYSNITLIPYKETLLVGEELNKLASNNALGRDHAGVHYRSDSEQGLLLGEQVALDLLQNHSFLIDEEFKGFNLTKFDGTRITIGGSTRQK